MKFVGLLVVGYGVDITYGACFDIAYKQILTYSINSDFIAFTRGWFTKLKCRRMANLTVLSAMQYSNTPSCSKKYVTFLRIFVILATSLLASNVFSIEDLRASSMYALLSISPSLAHRTYYYVHTILKFTYFD